MQRKTRYFCFCLALLGSAVPGSKVTAEDKIPCVQATTKMTIDGKLDDWNKIDARYYNQNGTVIGLCNDSSYLYLQIRFRNPRTTSMIRRHGITIWLDPRGKKDEYYRLRYNNGLDPDQIADMRHGRDSLLVDGPHQRPMPMMDRKPPEPVEINCYREGWRSPRSFALNAGDPVAAAFDTSFSFYVYEFRVPLGDSLSAPDGFEPRKKGKLSLGIEMTEMPSRRGGEMPRMEGGFGGPGGGGRMGEDPFGDERPRDNDRDRERKPEKKEEWYKFELAKSGSR